LAHKCPNGDDFSMRAIRALRGEKAPYPNLKEVFKRKMADDPTLVNPKNGRSYGTLDLSPEDIDWLIGLKVKW